MPTYAKQSKADPTLPESRLWEMLRARRLGGLKFRRQHRIEGARPDFFCPALGLVVEVDGHTHDPQEDARRDAALERRGLATLRFSNTDVVESLEGVCHRILAFARSLPPRVYGSGEIR